MCHHFSLSLHIERCFLLCKHERNVVVVLKNTDFTHMRTAIVGGGAAGFFCALELKRRCGEAMEVVIFEQQRKVLAKVEISGGGRCNCTNSFRDVTDLRQVYPRGGQLLKRLFKVFGPKDAYEWFEEHGVELVVQDDQCVFPKVQDSHAIIDCFVGEARRLGVQVRTNCKVEKPDDLLGAYDFVVWTVGGLSANGYSALAERVKMVQTVPSLFTFNIKDKRLNDLMGVVVEDAIVSIPGTKFKVQDALLITHWGVSGPATLKLSSHAARYLNENGYKAPLLINWVGETNAEVVKDELVDIAEKNSMKMVSSYRPFGLQQRLWDYLLGKIDVHCRWSELGKKNLNKLVDVLTNDHYQISGRAAFKDEFVTCGGVSLEAVDKNTLESREVPGLYFAGEVLDIDGVTGGFNFQAAWTCGYVVAKSVGEKVGE